ncbi:helix-turn-helix transcriptional regulator [Streptacidiphilus cavernicola]|uniref:LuxR C-terminal-related transcriptional regulator n=1 Tax=Streptacidiphilus cavernicola TaxID=3342716 RepID=A0ABV6VVW3_9ACTN
MTTLDPNLPPELDGYAITLYLCAIQDGELTRDVARSETGLGAAELDRSLNQLVENRLLAPAAGSPDLWLPINPEVAAARVVEPMEDMIRTYRQSAERTRERVLQLMPAYLARTGDVLPTGQRSVETITDAEEVRILIRDASDRCSKELMTVHPSIRRDPTTSEGALSQNLEIITRGVRMRVLYQHTVRADLPMHSYASTLVGAGAQVRTADQLTERMLIFDRQTVFIPKWSQRDQTPGAVIVREPVLVSFLCSLFEQFWLTAVPFGLEGPGYQGVSDEMRRSILQLLGQGLKDEGVARKLGMSVRTCRRHIAALMQELGAESRFEAGVKAAQLGLLIEDSNG